MIVLANLLLWLANVLGSFAWLYKWIVIIGVLISWLRLDPWNPIVRFFRGMVDPPCGWIRRKFPFVVAGGMIDLSPIVLLLGLEFIDWVVVRSLIEYAHQLRMGLA